MKDYMFLFFLGFVLGFCVAFWISRASKTISEQASSEEITVQWKNDHLKLTKENLINELKAQEIDFIDIVLAQAILETDYFKSYACTNNNNLFGLRKKDGGYMSFNHWTESVAAYKKYIQNYDSIPKNYYQYLIDKNYIEDPNYIKLLQQIVRVSY